MTLASGIGLATLAGDTVLEVWYPAPGLGDDPVNPGGLLEREDDVRGVRSRVVTTTVDLDQPPTSTADAYLRLHLLSHRLVRPNEANQDGLFGILPSGVWTTLGPGPPEGFEGVRAR
ncbi:MAG: 2,3,4,5-tetrahydropyridine-2,6-dicarboxylate N-succinyltransferase, partial [Actinomycetes bacterium]|nr:2,3,4,5-tetrahydropyridine-2,6-dicarboxylate N-succinyltransferase [Actinomycetes bacterium]MDX5380387.1 2,3,4,5-tetrahydropyridine-2,6-dicarboxylate N-succinyltransferase [Actinomycetes bacterium]MDX5399183.1 2,3,4,5-tetrahydropyridine-2,6-dicarboxylate N-succinyltransferase [Actinomycetes bacterium]MDX5450120.1 2,3,4,5-tetrahydropyridine-2,6-dicarboxylate N-succinyltransferase [Actinomycetes bacterium]